MTINEAFNKGLDVAENEAIDKLTKALRSEVTEPFNNPKMEELRQSILRLAIPVLPAETDPGGYVGDTSSHDRVMLVIRDMLIGDGKRPTFGGTHDDIATLDCLEKILELAKKCIKKKTKDGLQMEAALDELKTKLTNHYLELN